MSSKAVLLRRIRSMFWPLMFFAVLLVFWEVMVAKKIWDPAFLPSPREIAAALWASRGELAIDLATTGLEVVLGFIVTAGAAMLAAVALHLLPRESRGVYSVFVILQSVPLFAIAPLLFYWTGPGMRTRLIVIVLAAFFPVLVNTVEGLRNIDRELLDLFDSMGATRWQKLVRLELPSALHMVIAGFQITLTMCVIGAVLAEMIIGDMNGVGYRIKQANAFYTHAKVFACLALLSAMVIVLLALLNFLAKRFQPWTAREDP